MFGQFFFRVSQYVASSLSAPLGPPPEAEEEAPPDDDALLEAAAPPDDDGAIADDDGAIADDDAPSEAEGALEADDVDDDDPLPAVDGVLLLLQDEMSSANALIPAMVAIALLADVRDTRPTSVSWDVAVRALTAGPYENASKA